jgi:hypothetical protein
MDAAEGWTPHKEKGLRFETAKASGIDDKKKDDDGALNRDPRAPKEELMSDYKPPKE